MSSEKTQPKKNSRFISYTVSYPIIPDALEEEIKSIRLIGEFGTWSGWIDMKKNAEGTQYQTDLIVRPGTTICYKYLINGHIWSTDLSLSSDSKSIKDEDGHMMVIKKVEEESVASETSSLRFQEDQPSVIISEEEKEEEKEDDKAAKKDLEDSNKTLAPMTVEENNKEKKAKKPSFFKRFFCCCF